MNTAVLLAIVVLGYILLVAVAAAVRYVVPRLRHLFNVLMRSLEGIQWPKRESQRWNAVRRIPAIFDAILLRAMGGPDNAILYRFAQIVACMVSAILFVVWLNWLVTPDKERSDNPVFWLLSISFGALILSVSASCLYDVSRESLRRLLIAKQDAAREAQRLRELEEAQKLRLRQLEEAQRQLDEAERRREEEGRGAYRMGAIPPSATHGRNRRNELASV